MQYEESQGTLTLRYPTGATAVVKAAKKTTHVTFELVSIDSKEKVEVVVWGPYATRIKEIIGETVGVVRNDRFALGIQTLNVKTLGGYPTDESDVMPGRGDTAVAAEFGSVLQAFTRDRSQDRVISNWAHKTMLLRRLTTAALWEARSPCLAALRTGRSKRSARSRWPKGCRIR